ncbi:uncharacterized protein [Setaria viridis]|uniref:uncharacterized protein isoform X2 n=1 Tax=Setaria viridis TaxID=4556 RepID=UPI001493BE00|nr:uncharacterized protein LOC117846108 isoform X3 [Setaria viridis]
MAPKRGRARKGDRRIDAAIDHFAPMGYTARQVRTAVNALLKEYLGAAAWPFLEDSSYLVVQEKLLEMEDEEKKAPPTLEQEIQEEEQPEQEQPQVEHGCSYYEKSSGPVSMRFDATKIIPTLTLAQCIKTSMHNCGLSCHPMEEAYLCCEILK